MVHVNIEYHNAYAYTKKHISNLNWQKYMQMEMVFCGIAKCKTKSSHDNQNFTNG